MAADDGNVDGTPAVPDTSWVRDVLGEKNQQPVQPPARQQVPPQQPQQPPYVPPQFRPPQYGQPQQGQPQYGQPQYGQPQYRQPPYGPPQFRQPGYPAAPGQFPAGPPARKSSAGAIIGIIAGVLVMILVTTVALVNTVSDITETAQSDEPGSGIPFHSPDPYVPDPVEAPEVADDEPVPEEQADSPSWENTEPETEVVGDEDKRFRAGEFATKLPKISKKYKYTSFTSKYHDATDWLYDGTTIPKGLKVVFTADPKYNCALAYGLVSKKDNRAVAGCYNPQYYKTLFMWWGTNADEYTKQFILMHEFSHFVQWWDYYDAMNSATKAGLYDSAHNRQVIIESDATCRVVYDWNWEEIPTASPCKAKKWDDEWLNRIIVSKGVEIVDW